MTGLMRLRQRLAPTVAGRVLTWYRNLGLNESDILLAGYPKSGNTWLKFLVGDVVLRTEIDWDSALKFMPMMGWHRKAPRILDGGGRLISTHDPFRQAYRRNKVIYIMRDGRDVAVSFYYHQLRLGRFEGTFQEFLPAFLAGRVTRLGSWHTHVCRWVEWGREHPDKVLLVTYDTLKENPEFVLSEICRFLGVDVKSDEIRDAVKNNTFEKMREKEQKSVIMKKTSRKPIPFVREGKSGCWRDVFSQAQAAEFERVAGVALALVEDCTQGWRDLWAGSTWPRS